MDVKICTFENTSGNPFRVSFPRKLCHLWPSFFPFFVGIQAFPSPEDYRRRPVPINADVERVRRYNCKFFFLVNDIGYKLEKYIDSFYFHCRAHLNDLENIPIFMITAWLYMFSGMPVSWGIWCLRVFTAARVFHTIVYLNAFSYPRAVSFAVGACCTAFMAICVLYSVI